MKKQIIISAIVLVVVGGRLLTSQALAADKAHDFDTLVQKISDTFHLNKDDVQNVVTKHRSDHMAKRQSNYEDLLSQAVKEGKLTDVQKSLILVKRKELADEVKSKKDTLKNMTPEERKAAMQKQKQALKDWAKQNNIDLTWLMPGFGMRGHLGYKK